MFMTTKSPYFPNLEAEISKKGVKKNELAEKLNVSNTTLSNKLAGKYDFNLSEIFVIHSIFPNITIEELFTMAS